MQQRQGGCKHTARRHIQRLVVVVIAVAVSAAAAKIGIVVRLMQ
jgi:hypothetical protein